MHFYFHILTDTERIVDLDGEEFAELPAALVAASQSARDLMADSLRAGRRPPFGWSIQVVDGQGIVLSTLNFASIAFQRAAHSNPLRAIASTEEIIQQSKWLLARTKERQAEVRRNLADAHAHLRTLARLQAGLTKYTA